MKYLLLPYFSSLNDSIKTWNLTVVGHPKRIGYLSSCSQKLPDSSQNPGWVSSTRQLDSLWPGKTMYKQNKEKRNNNNNTLRKKTYTIFQYLLLEACWTWKTIFTNCNKSTVKLLFTLHRRRKQDVYRVNKASIFSMSTSSRDGVYS